MKRKCPKCGNVEENFVNGVCVNCTIENQPLVYFPKPVDIPTCKFCSKVHYQTKWLPFSPDMLNQMIQSQARSKLVDKFEVKADLVEEEKVWNGILVAKAELGGQAVIQETPIEIKKTITVCDSCMKLKSDYFEATVQIRFEGKLDYKRIHNEVQKAIQFLIAGQKEDALSVLVSTKQDKHGIDLIIGSKKAGRDLADFLARESGIPVVATSSLIGLLNGKPKKRFTFCVRL